MDPGYAAGYRDLYRRHWWWRAREFAILREIRRLQPQGGWGRILDVGCGDGLLFDRLQAFGRVEGVEPDQALLDPAGPHRGAIHVGPFDDRFRPAHRFGLILMLDVLEHMAAPEAALRHAVGLLEPGGSVLVTVPAFPQLWTRHDDLNRHICRYTRGSFRALAVRAGLEIARERYLFQWLAPVKLGVRALEALGMGSETLPSVPPAAVNRLLEVMSRGEIAIALRLPLPFGSSLLVSGTAAGSRSPDPGA
jgi:SAM-dependent methyltransferase